MQERFPTVMFGCNRSGHTHFSEVVWPYWLLNMTGEHDCHEVGRCYIQSMDHFLHDIMHTWKFDYYSADRTLGGNTCFKCIAFYGENPTSARIPACKLCLGIAIGKWLVALKRQYQRVPKTHIWECARRVHISWLCRI